MSKKLISINIVSQRGTIYRTNAKIINLRGENGEMGISYGHSQLLSTIPPSIIRIEQNTTKDVLYISGGIIEVQPDQVIVLADEMEQAKNLDKIVAENDKLNAESLIRKAKDVSIFELKEAKRALAEAEARLLALKVFSEWTS